ncbi:PIN domain-containing protein [Psychrobacillus sp. FSL K6-2684]|uniref:PIN domain-containing protein n=1 Tax=Psychrobacillus sp. FSL K6-2684 TaxID=2921547 RepID=UPI0030F67368
MEKNDEKVSALIIDTNILLYLFQPDKYPDEVFNRFISNILFLQADLVVTTQIIEEWNRHKETNYQKFLTEITHSISEHEKLVSFMEKDEDKQNMLTTLSKIKKMEIRKYKYTFGKRAESLDNLLNAPRTIILDRTEGADKLVVDFALRKDAPFFGSDEKNGGTKIKNEAADALIYFTIYDHFKIDMFNYTDIYFVSENKKDFSKANNPAELHENLQPYAKEINMKFFNSLDRAMLDFNPTNYLVKDFFAGVSIEFLSDTYFEDCPSCGEEVHINADSQIDCGKPPLLQTYLLNCKCGHTWDTGDLVINN